MIHIIITIVLLVLLAAVIAIFAICGVINEKTFRRYVGWSAPYMARYDYYEAACPREAVSFQGSHGDTLRGFLYPAAGGADKGLVVFCHGIWAVPEEYLTLISYFVSRGFSVFTYCNSGAGYSDGKNLYGLQNSPLDLDCALKYIEGDSRFDGEDIFLCGHSWGAYAVTAGLNMDHSRVKGAVALSGFNTPAEVSYDTMSASVGKAAKLFMPFVKLIYRAEFGKNANLSAAEGIDRAGIPVLIVHGKNDAFIHYDVSAIISHRDEIQNPRVSYITLDEVGMSEHNTYFCDREGTDYAAELAEKYQPVKKEYGGKAAPDLTQPSDPDDLFMNNDGIPADVLTAFEKDIDYDTLTRQNIALFDEIGDFLERAKED